MKKIHAKKGLSWLKRFLHLHIFVSLIAFVILSSWGIPFSLLSPVGNFIFSPLLYLFLFCASLVFFTQLLGIPNSLLIVILEKICTFWLTLIKKCSTAALIGMRQPSLWSTTLIGLLFLVIMHIKSTTSYRLILFLLLSIGIITIDRATQPSYQRIEIPCHKKQVTLINDNRTTTLIDPGAIGTRMSAQSWVHYTLIPTLVKTTGSPHIDTLILLDINSVLFSAIDTLTRKVSIGTLYLPRWHGTLPASWHHAYTSLCSTANSTGTRIHFFGLQTTTITTANTALALIPRSLRTKKGVRIPQITLTETKRTTEQIYRTKNSTPLAA